MKQKTHTLTTLIGQNIKRKLADHTNRIIGHPLQNIIVITYHPASPSSMGFTCGADKS